MTLDNKSKSNDNYTKDVEILELQIIKNRFGNHHAKGDSIDFKFYCKYNYFEDFEKKTKTNNKKCEKLLFGNNATK